MLDLGNQRRHVRHFGRRDLQQRDEVVLAVAIGANHPLPNLGPSWKLAPTQPALFVRGHPATASGTWTC